MFICVKLTITSLCGTDFSLTFQYTKYIYIVEVFMEKKRNLSFFFFQRQSRREKEKSRLNVVE